MSAQMMSKDRMYAYIEKTVVECFGPDGMSILAQAFNRRASLSVAMAPRATKAQMLEGLSVLLDLLKGTQDHIASLEGTQ